jgi:hypothetical protein
MKAEVRNKKIYEYILGQTTEVDFAEIFKSRTPQELTIDLLNEALVTKSADTVECAIMLIDRCGTSETNIERLQSLIKADWHTKHEDIISMLDDLRDERNLDVFIYAVCHFPPHLKYDEGHALARKAIYGLSNLNTPASREVLSSFAMHQTQRVRDLIKEQSLKRQS